MNDIEIALLNYENQLIDSRKQLNDLIFAYHKEPMSHALLNDKIDYLQREIMYIDNQLNILRGSLDTNSQEVYVPQQTLGQAAFPSDNDDNGFLDLKDAQEPIQAMEGAVANPHNEIWQGPYNAPKTQNEISYKQDNTTWKAFGKKDLENVIGKSWMGIFASVLIFISLILFATVLAPFFTDTMKMAAMYMISMAFTAFGLVKLRRKKNKAYLAISSCGVGAIYISLFLSNLYFKAIGEIPLYVCLLIWVVFVCCLARFRDMIFQIIGQCGIIISLLFGIFLCAMTQNQKTVFLLSLFFVITSFSFYVINFTWEFHRNTVNHVCNIINVGLLAGELLEDAQAGPFALFARIVVLLFLFVQFLFFFLSKLQENNVGFGIFTVINALYVMLLFWDIVDSVTVYSCICMAIGCIVLAVIERKCKDSKDLGRILLQIFVMIVLALSVNGIPFLKEHVSVAIVMIPILALGYDKKDRIYKYGSLVMAAIYLCSGIGPVEYLCFGAIYFGLFAYLFFSKKEQYDMLMKLLSYVVFLWFLGLALGNILSDAKDDIIVTVVFAAVSILNLVAMRSGFTKNFVTMETEPESITTTQMLHAMFMLYVLHAILYVDNEVCHIFLILLALLLFIVNCKNLLERYKGWVPGSYIGIKLTVLVVTILSSFHAANYVISISAFLLAIISIVVGFRVTVKAFRIYGLVLSMLSVIKLVMVDISYKNTLGHALSFFGCGVLCFVISMIYNQIDKKVQGK